MGFIHVPIGKLKLELAEPWWLRRKESACNPGDLGSVSGLGRSPGEEHGNPLQYSCLQDSVDRGALWATVHGVAELDTRSDYAREAQKWVLTGKKNF